MTEKLVGQLVEGNIVYPIGYKVYRRGEYILLRYGEKEEVRVVDTVSKTPILTRSDTTNWLIAAAGTYNPKDIDDWLEDYDDVLGIYALGFFSDRKIDLTVRLSATARMFNTRKDTEVVITPQDSPMNAPTVIIYSFGDTYVPHFELDNNDVYTPRAVIIKVFGHRYKLMKTKYTTSSPPKYYDTVDLNVIMPQ